MPIECTFGPDLYLMLTILVFLITIYYSYIFLCTMDLSRSHLILIPLIDHICSCYCPKALKPGSTYFIHPQGSEYRIQRAYDVRERIGPFQEQFNIFHYFYLLLWDQQSLDLPLVANLRYNKLFYTLLAILHPFSSLNSGIKCQRPYWELFDHGIISALVVALEP